MQISNFQTSFIAIVVDGLVPAGAFKQLRGWTMVIALVVMLWNEIFGKIIGIRLVKFFPEKAFCRFIQTVTIISVLLMLRA